MKKTLLFFFLFLQIAAAYSQPTTPATNMTFNSLDGGAFRINWTSGNGARRIVVARMGSAVTAAPVNGVDYNHNNTFGSGDVLSPGQFVIADGANSFVDVSGLQPATTYHFAIFEYNGTGAATQYLFTPLQASNATLGAPTLQASNIVFSNVTGNSLRIDVTAGNGQRRLILMRSGSAVNSNPSDLNSYSGVTIFGSGSQLGIGNYAVLSGTATNVTVTGLQPNTTYHIAVFEFNGSSTPVYLVPGATGNVTTAVRPTVAASGVFFSSVEGNTMRVNWVNGNGSRRIVVARQGSAVTASPSDGTDYTHNNAFGSGDALAPGQYIVYDGLSNFVDLSNLLPNTIYHFRVYEYDGTGAAIAYLAGSFGSGSQSTSITPTIQAGNLVFSNISGTTLTATWINGNGARRIVVARAGAPVNADPVDLVSYFASGSFGSGAQLGSGNFVVYNGNGSSVNITALSINTTYHFAIYEYNGVGGPVYLLPAHTSSVNTPAQPTIAASGITFNSQDGNAMRVNWVNGNGARRIVIARQGSAVTGMPSDGIDYVASPVFGAGDAIAPGGFVVYDGTSSFVDLSGLQSSTVYHFSVFEYNSSGATTAYLLAGFPSASQSTLSAPTVQTSGLTFTNVSGSNVRLNWTNGNGSRRIIIARAGSAVNADPVDFISYFQNPIFGSGNQIGTGNYVVFNGASPNNQTVTGLTPNTTYHFAAYEYNGSGGTVYMLPPLTGNVTTAARPTLASLDISFSSVDGNTMRVNWVNGNGARRIVIARQGSAVTAVPADGIDYLHNGQFGSGEEVSPGQFVVMDGTSNFADLTNLAPGTVYHFAIFEYDGTGVNTSYLTTPLTGSQSTINPPTIQASNITFTSVAATSATVNWTIGNGSRRIVVARQGSPVNADPVDLLTYNGNAFFGSGTQIGSGNYAVYLGNASNFTISGLISGTTYHFAVYELNGNGGPVYLRPGVTGSVTTIGAPQVQATNGIAGNVTAVSMQLNWTNGSGNRRLVLMKQGTAVDAAPVNNGSYTANSFYGSGTQLGTGNYVVYDGTGSSVIITNLQSNLTYHFAVFEYNSFGATSQFLLTNPAIGNATTITALPVNLVSFRGIDNRDHIKLEWTTAGETNNAFFEVQKSKEGMSFDAIGRVDGHGNSAALHEYGFTDDAPFNGYSFYRLKQVDADNSFSYSRVIRVRHDTKGLVKKYVNPVNTSVQVQLNENISGEWILYDLAGRMVRKENVQGNVIQADISSCPDGTYVMEISSAKITQRIVLLKRGL